MSHLIHFSKAGFEQAVNSGSLVIADFWANWCGPCKMIGPSIEKLADQFAGQAIVGKIDVDQEEDLAMQFGIMSIPCVVVLKDGAEINRVVGACPYEQYEKLVQSYLK